MRKRGSSPADAHPTKTYRFNANKGTGKKYWKKDSNDSTDQKERKTYKIKCYGCCKLGHKKAECRSSKSKAGDQEHKDTDFVSVKARSMRVENDGRSKNRQIVKNDAGSSNASEINRNDKSSLTGQNAGKQAGQVSGEVVRSAEKSSKAGPTTAVLRKMTHMIAYTGRIQDSICTKNDWISDSGASHHVCGSMEWFSFFEKFPESSAPSVLLADNIAIKPLGKGVVTLEAFVGKKWVEWFFRRSVLYPWWGKSFLRNYYGSKRLHYFTEEIYDLV